MTGSFLSFIARIIISLRYSVKISGLRSVASKGKKGILFLPNHPALIDPVISVSRFFPKFRPLVLADRDQVDFPVLRSIIRPLNIMMFSDPTVYGRAARDEIEKALGACIERLSKGGNVLLYPSGRTAYTSREEIGGASAVETIVRACPDTRIVLVRMSGLWGSRFSRSAGHRPSFGTELKKGMLIVLSNLLFFTPRRRIRIECEEHTDFPRTGTRSQMNRYMEDFYNRDISPRLYVPYRFWERGGTRKLPEIEKSEHGQDISEVPESTRSIVTEHLRELTGVSEIKPEDHLARDLAMDSLTKLELFTWIESEFGISVNDPESVQTVTDVMLSTRGTTFSGTVMAMSPVPRSWFRKKLTRGRVRVPEGDTIGEVFLAQAKECASLPAVADQTRGVLSYRSLILAIMVLRPSIAKLRGKYVGIMLPSVSAVVPVYLATLFAGKIPVMVNWTAGMRNMKHSLSLLNVENILTSSAFTEKLVSQGADLSDIEGLFLYMEEMGKSIGLVRKISALIRSRISWKSLREAHMEETAVVLFTSGSESLPKAVPLTHHNLLTNIKDALSVISIYNDDVFLGFLPPFHSFGIVITVLLPVCCGIRTVFHPNPTEGFMIARTSALYGTTVLVGTPTFLDGITRAASVEELASVRLAVAGGEKFPDRLYDFIANKWPSFIILEGYGITECSPIVAVNHDTNPVKNTIGPALPLVEYAIRDVDTGLRVPSGSPGILLVRGPSIFSGYLYYNGESPFEEFEGKTWYRTGDIVTENSDGVFTFSGRLKRFVKLGGEMISLPAIEEILLTAFQKEGEDTALAIESTASETNPEIVLFTVLPLNREEANRVIASAGMSPIHNIRIVRQIKAIPLLGTGKTNYRQLKEMLKEEQ